MNKKKKWYDFLMVLAALMIVAAGVLAAFHLKGNTSTTSSAASSSAGSSDVLTVSEVKGNVNITRQDVAYTLSEGDVLQEGDVIASLQDSEVTLSYGDSTFLLEQNSTVEISSADRQPVLQLTDGSMCINQNDAGKLTMQGKTISSEDSVYVVTSYSETAAADILSGTIDFAEDTAQEKQALLLQDGKVTSSELTLDVFNDEELTWIRALSKEKDLCFTVDEIDALESERQTETDTLTDEAINGTGDTETESTASSAGTDTQTDSSAADSSGTSSDTAEDDDTAAELTCTIEIECTSLLNNLDQLAEGKSAYVPSDGIILSPVTVTFSQGDTVFDILKKVCSQTGIQLEYSLSTAYGTQYIEGINNLYQFDCGSTSGWMYKVNGWSPGYGCDSYEVSDGDVIVWYYTC